MLSTEDDPDEMELLSIEGSVESDIYGRKHSEEQLTMENSCPAFTVSINYHQPPN